MPRVIHFEVQAEDPERTGKFYADVFGWGVHKWDGPEDYWLLSTGANDQPGINGGLMRRRGEVGTVNTIEVPSVDEFTARVEQHGGTIVLPKMPVPGIGYLAYCKDTDGNIFGIMHPDSAAA